MKKKNKTKKKTNHEINKKREENKCHIKNRIEYTNKVIAIIILAIL